MKRTGLAGVVAVVAGVAGQVAAQDTPLSADFEEVYRVGGVNAPEWAFFEDASPVGFDGAGNLYVLDPEASQIVVIDARGNLVRTIGRKGEGPDELNLPSRLAVWRDGRFAVLDVGHAAYQVFTPDGELERFVRVTTSENPLAAVRTTSSGAIRPFPGGDALIGQGSSSFVGRMSNLFEGLLGAADEKPQERADDRGLERIDLGGDVISFTHVLQAWRAPREEEAGSANLADLVNPSGVVGLMGKRRFFEPRFRWDLLPDGTIAYSDSSAFAIKFAEAGGPVTDVLRRPLQPEAVNRRIRSATVEHALRQQEEEIGDHRVAEASAELEALMPGFAEGLAESFREEIENREFYPEIPVVRGLRATWEGGLWVQRRGAEPWDNEGPIDVIGADRQYVGTFAAEDLGMPAAFGPDGMVAFWEFDEMDVPSIVVKRLPAEVR